jgi:integrase
MSQADAGRMICRWAKAAGIKAPIGCHTFRATGITAYLENGGTFEQAQAMKAHESPNTHKLYNRTKEPLTPTRDRAHQALSLFTCSNLLATKYRRANDS